MPKEYIIFCDESESKGRKFSNFYGGALVDSDNWDDVVKVLAAKKHELNLFGEVKWSKITVNYYKKYIDLMETFFDLIADDRVKLRVMFTQNATRRGKLTREHFDNQYAILYYYFIRHAFGLRYSPFYPGGVRVRIYPDMLPLSHDECETFKGFVQRLSHRSEFRDNGISIRSEDITEVVSHHHDILQCLDVVLGAMNFRLNMKHKDRPEGAWFRAPKTRAKEKVYNAINKRICLIYPNFNIGITTGHGGEKTNRWHHPYRHWNFKTSERWH